MYVGSICYLESCVILDDVKQYYNNNNMRVFMGVYDNVVKTVSGVHIYAKKLYF